jgi:hypothetical protein
LWDKIAKRKQNYVDNLLSIGVRLTIVNLALTAILLHWLYAKTRQMLDNVDRQETDIKKKNCSVLN